MNEPDLEKYPLLVAEYLERIAKHISETCYNHDFSKDYNGNNKISYDDMDILRKIAKQVRRKEYLRLAEENK